MSALAVTIRIRANQSHCWMFIYLFLFFFKINKNKLFSAFLFVVVGFPTVLKTYQPWPQNWGIYRNVNVVYCYTPGVEVVCVDVHFYTCEGEGVHVHVFLHSISRFKNVFICSFDQFLCKIAITVPCYFSSKEFHGSIVVRSGSYYQSSTTWDSRCPARVPPLTPLTKSYSNNSPHNNTPFL